MCVCAYYVVKYAAALKEARANYDQGEGAEKRGGLFPPKMSEEGNRLLAASNHFECTHNYF